MNRPLAQNCVALPLLMAMLALPFRAHAQDGLANAELVGGAIAKACMFDTLDIEAEFASALHTIQSANINPVNVGEKDAFFTDASGANLILNRKVDSIACALIVPAAVATHAYFETIEGHIAYAFTATHATYLEEISSDPSPHVDGHDWVASFPGKLHHAISLQWGTDSGMILSVGFQQLYE